MKLAAVAPAPEALRSAASLLTFYRDCLDKLALWRLTECDPDMEDAMRGISDDLLSRCALLVRKMRKAGLLDECEKMTGLRLVDNPAHNPATSRSR